MSTTARETIFATAARHIIRCERRRAVDGAATYHAHDGITLCGRAAQSVSPWRPAKSLIASGVCCPTCEDKFAALRSLES